MNVRGKQQDECQGRTVSAQRVERCDRLL